MQNKMLLGLQPTKLQLINDVTNSEDVNTLIKMNDGYGVKITDKTIINLKKSQTLDYSLLGFVDKLKSSKFFPDGETNLKYIIADAKINIIKRIAAGETLLLPVHMLALYLYTGNYTIFKQVNMTLKDWSNTSTDPSSSVWYPFINCLYQSINIINPYIGEVYRAVDTKFTLDTYEIGKIIQWNSFSLCSAEWKDASDLIGKKTGVVFIIHSLTGRVISKYSKYPVDNEAIFLPLSKFKVINYFRADTICLAQANIRESTFKMTDSYKTRVLEGNECIIVELLELDDSVKKLIY
jgi:hypothetical protein